MITPQNLMQLTQIDYLAFRTKASVSLVLRSLLWMFDDTSLTTAEQDILPELDTERIGEKQRPAVVQAVARVLDSAFRESPGSVVDNCRDAMQTILSSWLAERGEATEKELAKVAAAIEREPHDKVCAANLGKVCAKLHSRNKSNAQRQEGYRHIVEEDAELAIQAVGFALRDLEWAKA